MKSARTLPKRTASPQRGGAGVTRREPSLTAVPSSADSPAARAQAILRELVVAMARRDADRAFEAEKDARSETRRALR